MSNPNPTESQSIPESDQSFGDLLKQFERSHARKKEDDRRQLEAIVVSATSDAIILDIGFKTEGILSLAALQSAGVTPVPSRGDKLTVTVKGRNPEGYYELSIGKVQRPTDWAALEKAFQEKAIIEGNVMAVVKGGVTVDIGVRAFMPASRTGTRDAAEMEKLVGQEIRCRITKLDVTEEDVVVDRRAVLEEEAREAQGRRLAEIKEGDTVRGTVRSLMEYGAFIDLGGIDGLLHVGEIAWGRVNKPEDVLAAGQEIEARVLKIEPGKKRISLSLKALQPQPWDSAPDKYKVGERARGTVTRIAEFGAFAELEPGVEGLIHLSEMSWAKKVRKPSDVVKPGDTVEVVILGVNPAERRISLGLKQALGDPWTDVSQRFPVGSVIEGPVTSVMKFGVFVQLAEGVEGMIHVSDISAEKRIDHPADVFKVGQAAKAQVLEIDKEKRRLKLGIKQMAPSSLDEYIAEHKAGDAVTGRIADVSGSDARVELGEGVYATCKAPATGTASDQQKSGEAKADLSSLTSMLKERWKSGKTEKTPAAQAFTTGQIRSFRITKLDTAAKKIEVELTA